METILGLDPGTNSIGWAIIERGEDIKLLEKGVHIFQEGVKIEKGIESSKASERSVHRAARRHLFRRRLRKIETLKALLIFDFCPPISIDDLKEWQSQSRYPMSENFINWQRTDDDKDKNPYRCRYEAVNRKLNLNDRADRYMLGRALYHIAQRRGFLSNRLETTKESDGKVTADITELTKEIDKAGCRTLGEYFYHCYGEDKIRNKYTSRINHYKAEFDEICKVQQLPDNMKTAFEKAIFFQRPLRSQKETIGKCTLEKGKARCPVSHPRYEYYRMLCFINNIRIKCYDDSELRPLNQQERTEISSLFYRKSKDTFDFEDIAKKLAGKNNYAYYEDPQGKPYMFNYKMNTTVSGSPTTAKLIGIFGDDWKAEIAKRYTLANTKNKDEIANDIWHVLFSFDKDESLLTFARQRLNLDDETATKFSKVTLQHDYAALSINAINKIIPYLEQGLKYSHAVFLANLGAILPKHIWGNKEHRENIISAIISEIDHYDRICGKTLQQCILSLLRDNFELRPCAEMKLYHPSMIDIYPKSETGMLGSPRTNAIRNPMAMRTLFQLRQLINKLIKAGKITPDTKINIELARELNNANMRKAIEQWQRDIEKENNTYRKDIIDSTGYEPTEDDILKYRLWIEQEKKCIYTGKTINLTDFINSDPLYDIEHTIPRSIGGDNSQMNKTLTDKRYNRDIKGNKIPSQLGDLEAIKVRIEDWKNKIEELEKQIESNKRRKSFSSKEDKDRHITKRNRILIDLKYWKGKYSRFITTDTKQDFRNSQGVDAGIISKYARLYLKSLFPKVYTIKGEITAEFRKLWGLQEIYQKKNRNNHIHHCIDAITIACIGKNESEQMTTYHRMEEDYRWWGKASKPFFNKPWATFTEDVKSIEEELLISHYSADNLGKNTKKRLRIKGKVVTDSAGNEIHLQGDTARGSLHLETFYGAILRNDEIVYVVRKSISQLKDAKDANNIVDDVVREKVLQAIANLGFKEAINSTIWMNEEKGIAIKKVRCIASSVTKPLHIRTHRDESRHEHKRQYHVANERNYIIAIYKGDGTKSGFEVVNNIDATALLKHSTKDMNNQNIVPLQKSGIPLKYILKTGTMVIFWENSPEEIWSLDKKEIAKRLYKVIGFSTLVSYETRSYGRFTFKHHQEARAANELTTKNGEFCSGEQYRPLIGILHTQFKALVQGYDFELNILGEVIPLNK